MLGRLARWLRILGYDTAFDPHADDWALVRRARAEGRLLVTRDHQLAARRGVSVLLIQSEELAGQVRQVVAAIGSSPEGAFTRCLVCNQCLTPLSRERARARVPLHVYRAHQEFQLCQECGRVYWRGTHWDRMKETVDNWQDLTLMNDRSIMEVGAAEDPSGGG
jgi:uncharacterized protein with PIN domain